MWDRGSLALHTWEKEDMTELAQLDQDQIDEFVLAAHHDLARVQQMFAQEPRLLNESATWIETALAAAAHTANRPIAEFLVERGAPMDICAAAMLGRADDVLTLLNEDPTLVNATGAHDIPVLFHAAVGGHLDLVRMLIERGADVNGGRDRNTALHGAAGFGQLEIARYLLDQGADFTALDHEGRTPLDVAEDTGHDAIVDLLRSYMEIE